MGASTAPRGTPTPPVSPCSGSSPTDASACSRAGTTAGDALLEKRVWMEPGANTTYVGYTLTRAATTLALRIKAFVNHRGHHSTSRGDGWHMDVAAVPGGVRVLAFDGARPLLIVAGGTTVTPATRPEHTWYRAYGLARGAP
jgi:Glycogen debranching enzyme N terminal